MINFRERYLQKDTSRYKIVSICFEAKGGIIQYTHLLNNALSDIGCNITMITAPLLITELKGHAKKYKLLTLPTPLLLDWLIAKIFRRFRGKKIFTFKWLFIYLSHLLPYLKEPFSG